MATTRISLIGEAYDCVAPLFDGVIAPAGIEIVATRAPSPEAMRRQLTKWEFDVCEMAFGAYLIAKAQGADVTAIPVFPRRAFFHTQFVVHAGSGIAHPAGLNARRVGVAEYVQSATLWARGMLAQDFNVDSRSIQWYVERSGADSTGAVLGFTPPADIAIVQTPGGKSVAAMVQAGELEAALVGSLFQRIETPFPPAVHPLFADIVAEGKRFHAVHGYVPANHMYMIRGSLARERPELVAALYRAFHDASEHARRALPATASEGQLYGNEYLVETCRSLPGDLFAYGIAANRPMLEQVARLCREQGLVNASPRIEDMFAPRLE